MGNHDLHISRRIPEHSAIFDFPRTWYEMEVVRRAELTHNEIWLHDSDQEPNYSVDDCNFLRTLSEYEILETPDYKILFSHYAYPNLSGFRKEFYGWEGDFNTHFRFMNEKGCSLSFIGHAHPKGAYLVTRDGFRRRRYRKLKLNAQPVVIGIPPVTRNYMRSGFCIFDTSSRTLQIFKQL